ncbi:MAG: tetratricopeptide repeat protein [Planctomycetaceae bacterium]|nr:tetratricopeptide repeat protein [Planctomycetaceae bacterium]
MASDEEVRRLAAKGWSPEIDALFENGLPDAQMRILEAAGLFDDDNEGAADADDGLPPPLENEIDLAIQDTLGRAEQHMGAAQWDEAVAAFQSALRLLPAANALDEYATRGWTGIADALFFQQKYADAREALEQALKCDGGTGNAFVHLRLGQCCLNLQQTDAAADQLTRAYMAAGPDIFQGEDEMYFAFLQTRITIR